MWLPAGAIGGAGMGAPSVGVSSAAALSVAPRSFAAATGLNVAARQVGGALGVAILAVLLDGPTPSAGTAPFRDVYLFAAIEATRLTEANDPHCLAPTEIARLLHGAPWRRLVVIGDSVAAGVREPVDGYRDLSSSDRVAEALREQRPTLFYRNLAQREKHVAEIRAEQLGDALALEPDLVIVSAGGNDALRSPAP